MLGLAALFDRLQSRRWRIRGIVAGFIGYTFLLLIQYQAFMHGLRDVVPYPRGFADLWLARFRVPFDLMSSWLTR